MKALILAAGYAVRLYPLTKEQPKSLLPVGGRPMINRIIEKLERIPELDSITVVTNSKFIGHFRQWQKTFQCSKDILLVDDLTTTNETRRGAIGDIYFALCQERLDDDLLVIGGDNIFDGKLEDFLSFARGVAGHPVIGVHDIQDITKAHRYGVMQLNADNKIIDFEEKPAAPRSTLVAMCLYFFPKEKLALLHEYCGSPGNKHDATGFYIDWLRKREPVYGYILSGRWYDIGDAAFYQEADGEFS